MQQRLQAVLQIFSLTARFLPTAIAVLSADVFVVLIVNMNGMQARKRRVGTSGRDISSSVLSSGRDQSAQGTHYRALEAFCDADWFPVIYVQAALTGVACCINHKFICWLRHTE